MLFHEIDHGEWLPFFGIKLKVMRWILGNPLIAITMMRHDLTAGLRVPVELLLVENESGEGSTVIYALPSSLMVIEPIRLGFPPRVSWIMTLTRFCGSPASSVLGIQPLFVKK